MLAEKTNNLDNVLEIFDGGRLFKEYEVAIPIFMKDKWKNI